MVAISVILPVYNVEKHLNKCLHTIVNQLFDDYEVICVNDGSTDSSPEILKKYAEKYSNIKIINQENKGLSAARNTGLDNAKGEYILFADSDDYFIAFNAFNMLYNFAKSNNSDLVIFDILRGDDKEKYFELTTLPMIIQEFGSNAFNADIASTDIYRFIPAGVWTKFYKADLIKDIRFAEGMLYEDLPFWNSVYIKANKINYLNLPLYYYVKDRKQSITNNYNENSFDIFRSFSLAREVFVQSGYWEKLKNIMIIHFISNISHHVKNIKSELREKFVSEIKNFDIEINYNEFEHGNYFPFEKNDARLIHFIRDNDYTVIEKIFIENNIWNVSS